MRLGERHYDLSHRALVMGSLGWVADPLWDLDAVGRRADQVVAEGADILALEGFGGGPESEELDRVAAAVEVLHHRFDLPLSVGTSRAAVARASCRAGAVMLHDPASFADPGYLAAAAEVGATIVVTYPQPPGDEGVAEVGEGLVAGARRAERAGVAPDRIVLDAGFELGKSPPQSLTALRASGRLVAQGYPVVLSADATYLAGVEGDQREPAALAAAALGVALGCRIVRAHDVVGIRRVRDVIAAILDAEAATAERAAVNQVAR